MWPHAAFIFPTSDPAIDFSEAKRAANMSILVCERESLHGRMLRLQEEIRRRESEHWPSARIKKFLQNNAVLSIPAQDGTGNGLHPVSVFCNGEFPMLSDAGLRLVRPIR
jgi:hypothetical protein